MLHYNGTYSRNMDVINSPIKSKKGEITLFTFAYWLTLSLCQVYFKVVRHVTIDTRNGRLITAVHICVQNLIAASGGIELTANQIWQWHS